MFLQTMQRIAESKGFETFIHYAEQEIEVLVTIDLGNGYWRVANVVFDEYSDSAFKLFIEHTEDYLDITYQ